MFFINFFSPSKCLPCCSVILCQVVLPTFHTLKPSYIFFFLMIVLALRIFVYILKVLVMNFSRDCLQYMFRECSIHIFLIYKQTKKFFFFLDKCCVYCCCACIFVLNSSFIKKAVPLIIWDSQQFMSTMFSLHRNHRVVEP